MKNIIILISIIINIQQVIAQRLPVETWAKDSTILKAKAQKLRELYTLSTSGTDTEKYQKLFFLEFPNTYLELVRIYGYEGENDEDLRAGFLHEESTDHIYSLFNNLKTIPKKDYYNKIIKMSFGGKWQSDGVSIIRECIDIKFKEDPYFGFTLLSKYPDKDIHSFWYFFFDGPHPIEQSPKEFSEMKKSFPKVYNIMLSTLKEVQKKHPDHHQ